MIAQKLKIEKSDYYKIKSVISDTDSKSFYPKLMDRYNKSDTTLTKDEFRLLYYGFLFQDSYSSNGQSKFIDSLRKVMNKKSLSTSDNDTLIKYEKLVLKEFPFNLIDLKILAFAYQQKEDIDSAKLVNFKLNKLVGTILSTGDGQKEKTAWHIISVGHGYYILNFLGFKFGGDQSLTNKGCDYFKVQNNKYGIKGFYFYVNKIL